MAGLLILVGRGIWCTRGPIRSFGPAGRSQRVLSGIAADSPAKRLIEAAREIQSRTGISGLTSAQIETVLGLLKREFRVKDIQAAVAESLKSGPDVDSVTSPAYARFRHRPRRKNTLRGIFDRLFEAWESTLRVLGHQIVARGSPP